MACRISLLADHPHLIPEVAELRWREWGHAPEPEDPAWWLAITTKEAGRAVLPVTFVASHDGVALGAVGLGQFDIEERRDCSPWVMGLVVRPGDRARGVGRALIEHLADWARDNGFVTVWAATGRAEAFYRRCGWSVTESVWCAGQGQSVTVLRRELEGKRP